MKQTFIVYDYLVLHFLTIVVAGCLFINSVEDANGKFNPIFND